jgi:NTP pyrophosphatase (non-canonical NTP hydrolase)
MDIKHFIEFVKDYSYKLKDPYFSMNALIGELGEVANVIKKKEFYSYFKEYQQQVDIDIKNGKRTDYDDQLIDEFGDTLFYFIQLMISLNLDLSEIIDRQENKLINQSIELGRKYIK